MSRMSSLSYIDYYGSSLFNIVVIDALEINYAVYITWEASLDLAKDAAWWAAAGCAYSAALAIINIF